MWKIVEIKILCKSEFPCLGWMSLLPIETRWCYSRQELSSPSNFWRCSFQGSQACLSVLNFFWLITVSFQHCGLRVCLSFASGSSDPKELVTSHATRSAALVSERTRDQALVALMVISCAIVQHIRANQLVSSHKWHSHVWTNTGAHMQLNPRRWSLPLPTQMRSGADAQLKLHSHLRTLHVVKLKIFSFYLSVSIFVAFQWDAAVLCTKRTIRRKRYSRLVSLQARIRR